MVRNEIDLVEPWLAHLLAEGFDRIVVADNLSTDGTREWLDSHREWLDSHPDENGRLIVLHDDDPGYTQSAKMTRMAASYAWLSDVVVPVDADELWFSLDGRPLADVLRDTDADVMVARPLVHVPHETDDPTDPNPFTRIRHRQTHPEPHPKMAFRWQPGTVIDYGAHNVSGVGPRRAENIAGCRHFQWRSLQHVTRKARNGAAASDLAGLHPGFMRHWRTMALMSDADLDVWWKDYLAQETVLDPAPWRDR